MKAKKKNIRRYDGLSHNPRGADHWLSKLTDFKVGQIIKLYNDGWSGPAIAEKYGVSNSTVYGILKGVIWTHVKGERPNANK